MVEFIKAKPTDTRDLISVQNQAFYADFLKFGECPGYNRSCESMRLSIAEKHTYKIISDGVLIGDFIVSEEGNGRFFLGSLCIIPDSQNKGVGTLAMRYIRELFPDATYWLLETPEENTRNVHFYEKLGFRIKKRYWDGNVRIVLLERSS